jgi:hypothetical protein
LIGSRAARKFLPNLRNENESLIDYDIISSSTYLLEWLHKNDEAINTIEMIIPTLNEDQLDLYVTCILKDKSKYDFAVPRSSTSYTAYLLNNLSSWSYSNGPRYGQKGGHLAYAEAKLLLILKKYMLYYPHQWEKTAKDYQELLTIIDPLNDKDKELCDLFIRYNEKLHGKRSLDTSEFVITLHNNEQNIVIRRDEFFQYQKDEQIWCVYQAASKMSIDGDFLIGLEYICTKSPPWLADFVINNWMNIHNEMFKQRLQSPRPSIQFEISNYRLFQQLPELVIGKILHIKNNQLTWIFSLKLITFYPILIIII